MDSVRRWKIAAVIVSLIPIVFFLMFAIGEGASGAGHYIQVAPLIALVVLGWYSPKFTGYLLVGAGCVLVVFYALSVNHIPLWSAMLVEVIVFVPVVVSGILFLQASKYLKE